MSEPESAPEKLLPLRPTRSIRLPSDLEFARIVAFNVGPRQDVWIVEALEALDYRTPDNGSAVFPRTVPATPQRYRVRTWLEGSLVRDLPIEHEVFNIHEVQPLGGGEGDGGGDGFLLVCVRSHYRGPGDYERNGRVYDGAGRFQREILLGDGIQTIQATAGGRVWAAYFDEGVFGNFGWDPPVGASGLVAWGADGQKLYDYEPPDGMGSIDDCYALNVASDADVWCCYYSDFPLVHLHDRRVVGVWPMPVAGAGAFAVEADRVLMAGSYKDRDRLSLVRLGADGNARVEAGFVASDPDGARIEIKRIVGRGARLYVLTERAVHVLPVPER